MTEIILQYDIGFYMDFRYISKKENSAYLRACFTFQHQH